MARHLELLRHTDNDGDQLTPAGVAAAVTIGAALGGGYSRVWSSGAQRATQTAACLLAGLGEAVPGGVEVAPEIRSEREDEWRAAYARAGRGDLGSFIEVAPDLVAAESDRLGVGLLRLLEALGDGERGLAVGHSPTNEAAVLGLTGVVIPPLAKGAGVLVTAAAGEYMVEPLPLPAD